MKTTSARNFFHKPELVDQLAPGESLQITQNGKPSFKVLKNGKPPKRSFSELQKRAVRLTSSNKKLDLVGRLIRMRGSN